MPAQTTTGVATAFYSEGDTAPALRRQLQNGDGSPIDLTGATVRIYISYATYSHNYSPYQRIVDGAVCAIESPATSGFVQWLPNPGDLDTWGSFHFVFEIEDAGGKRQTVPAFTYETLVVSKKPGV